MPVLTPSSGFDVEDVEDEEPCPEPLFQVDCSVLGVVDGVFCVVSVDGVFCVFGVSGFCVLVGVCGVVGHVGEFVSGPSPLGGLFQLSVLGVCGVVGSAGGFTGFVVRDC